MNAFSKNIQNTALNASGLFGNSTTFYLILGMAGIGVAGYTYSKIKN
jgi:hypothetical protein